MKKRGILIVGIFLILIVSVSANKVDPRVEEQLEGNKEVSVVVMVP